MTVSTTLPHAVLWLDHHHARLLQFDEEQVQAKAIKDQPHDTRQHNSDVRTAHEFFGSVCDAMTGIAAVYVASATVTQVDFKHYVTKHRPVLLPHIAGWQTVNHPTDAELVALARKYFADHEHAAASKGTHTDH